MKKYLKWLPFYGKRYLGKTHITNNRWLFALWLYEEMIILLIISAVIIKFYCR